MQLVWEEEDSYQTWKSSLTKSQQYAEETVDGGKNPSQQRETLPVPQVPTRLMNVWCGRLDGIMGQLRF